MNAIDPLVAEEEPDEIRLAELKLSLEEKLNTLTRLDSEILDITEHDNVEVEIQEADEFKEHVYGVIVRRKLHAHSHYICHPSSHHSSCYSACYTSS